LIETIPSTIQLDRALAEAMIARDRKATAEFVQRLSGPLISYVRSRLQPRWEDVDDIVQETFLTALRSISNYRGDSPMRAWILGIARHKVEDYYRERLRQAELPDTEGELAEESGLDELLDRVAAREKTVAILRDLPDHYRVALLWRYWEQRSAAEMAELTGRTAKGVERLLARARIEFGLRWRSVRNNEASV